MKWLNILLFLFSGTIYSQPGEKGCFSFGSGFGTGIGAVSDLSQFEGEKLKTQNRLLSGALFWDLSIGYSFTGRSGISSGLMLISTAQQFESHSGRFQINSQRYLIPLIYTYQLPISNQRSFGSTIRFGAYYNVSKNATLLHLDSPEKRDVELSLFGATVGYEFRATTNEKSAMYLRFEAIADLQSNTLSSAFYCIKLGWLVRLNKAN